MFFISTADDLWMMGSLYSCCLKAMGYDNLDGNPANHSRIKYQMNNTVSDRDGRKYAKPTPEAFPRSADHAERSSSTPPPPSDTGCGPSTRGSPTSHCPGGADTTQTPSVSSMPKGFRDDGMRDRMRLKLSFGDNFKRSSSTTSSSSYNK